jgi:methyl-accepting chemotaxis protein
MKTESIVSAENEYLRKTNKTFSYALLAHIPVAIAFAVGFDSGILTAVLGSLAICSCPILLKTFTTQHKTTAIAHAMSLMFFSGLLIHLSKGMIETHFHIFVSIATLILYANPIVVLAATLTIAVHHLAFYFLLPASVFNCSHPRCVCDRADGSVHVGGQEIWGLRDQTRCCIGRD